MADGVGTGLAVALRAAIDGLLPRRCLLCADVMDSGHDAGDDRGGTELCTACGEQVMPSVAPGLVVYAGPVASLIQRAKYNRDLPSALGLARLAADRVVVDTVPDVVTFVPAHWTRALGRGFDLPALLADAIAQRLDRPWRPLLRATRRDARLADSEGIEARARLVAGRFVATQRLDGQRVLLVDDVHTTGATIGEATAVLALAGADVAVVTLALLPDVDD